MELQQRRCGWMIPMLTAQAEEGWTSEQWNRPEVVLEHVEVEHCRRSPGQVVDGRFRFQCCLRSRSDLAGLVLGLSTSWAVVQSSSLHFLRLRPCLTLRTVVAYCVLVSVKSGLSEAAFPFSK